MRYKIILLDFYGTLVEEDDAIIDRIVRLIATESPRSCTVADVARSWQFAELCRDSFDQSFKSQRGLELESLQALLDQYEVHRNALDLSSELFAYWRAPQACPSADGFLRSLKIPACIVSNIDDDDLEHAIRHNGWQFDVVVTSQQCRAYKPRPAPFQTALDKMGVHPDEVLHIGDSLQADVLGAQSLGIDIVWINRNGRVLPAGIKTPTHTVSRIGDVVEFLQ